MPSLSTVSWKYTQEKWLPSSRDLQKAWTGSQLQSDTAVMMLSQQLFREQGTQGAGAEGLPFLPLLLLLSRQMGTTGREGVVCCGFFFADRLGSLVYLSLLAVSSSKQIGKPAVLYATGLSARHTTYLGYSIGDH